MLLVHTLIKLYLVLEIQKLGLYYIDVTENYAKYFVNAIDSDVILAGHIIFIDRLYTSIFSGNCHLERNFTTGGTVNSNWYCATDELKAPGDCEEFSTTCHVAAEQGDFCFISYAVKAKSKRKENALLSFTMRRIHNKVKDDQKEKPAIYKFYDFAKGVTDIITQMNNYNSTREKH